MTHPLLHVATPEKRARRAMVREIGRRQARKELRVHRELLAAGIVDPLPRPPRPANSDRNAFKRVDAAFKAIVEVLRAHPQPGALRIAALAQLPVYRSRGKGRKARS